MAVGRREDQLLDAAIERLADVGLRVSDVRRDAGTSGAHIRIAAPSGVSLAYRVEVRNRISPAVALAASERMPERLMIVASHVTDSVADLLRARGIDYVDIVGNMRLEAEGLLIDVRGRRNPSAARPGKDRSLRAFKPSGLKVLFVLLTEPEMIAAAYREIAQASQVSLGTVQWVVKELEDAGYIGTARGHRRMRRGSALLDRWTEGYTLDLSPRLTLGRFEASDTAWWSKPDDVMRSEEVQWGGETAAHVLYRRLRPSRAVLYAPAIPRRLLAAHRLRKADGDANVEVRERFWTLPDHAETITVPTPLVYADLVASADPRQLEAAAYLREHDDLLRRIESS